MPAQAGIPFSFSFGTTSFKNVFQQTAKPESGSDLVL